MNLYPSRKELFACAVKQAVLHSSFPIHGVWNEHNDAHEEENALSIIAPVSSQGIADMTLPLLHDRTIDHPGMVSRLLVFVFLFIAVSGSAVAGSQQEITVQDTLSPAELKKRSLEELMEINVTIVSKQPQRLIDAPAEVYVISAEDIRRSGRRSIPDVLRLAPNLTVAQINASQWAISARGFNNSLANKLLVMIDGRVVYTPLYAGVFWDVQDVLLEDIDHIEVVAGPGGSLWGTNAVNGVINIVTRDAAETQGVFLEAGGGTEVRGFGGLRYGGNLRPNLHYRVYGKTFDQGSTRLLTGADANDAWHSTQGGYRFDWEPRNTDHLTLQSDFYGGASNPDGLGDRTRVRGGNALARWQRTLSGTENLQLQFYYDRAWRDFGNGLTEDLAEYDVDFQHGFALHSRHAISWGAGVRVMDDREENPPTFGFFPADKTLHLYTAFLQDEITLKENRLLLTLGTLLERNDYSGWEVQPSGRLAWTPQEHQTFWGALTRAVRTPSRTDRELFAFTPTGSLLLAGGPNFVSEELLAFELGWRQHPTPRLSASASLFYNIYDNIRSADPGPPLVVENGIEGETYGFSLLTVYELTDWWRLHGGYRFLRKQLSIKPGMLDINSGTAESDDPDHQLKVHSSIDLLENLDLDATLRYMGVLDDRRYVPEYTSLDLRVGWRITNSLELEIAGQNLLGGGHPEFGSVPVSREIQRSIYGRIALRP